MKNIRDTLKFYLDYQDYQLNHIDISLKREYICDQLYISYSDQYHKDIDHHISSKSSVGS